MGRSKKKSPRKSTAPLAGTPDRTDLSVSDSPPRGAEDDPVGLSTTHDVTPVKNSDVPVNITVDDLMREDSSFYHVLRLLAGPRDVSSQLLESFHHFIDSLHLTHSSDFGFLSSTPWDSSEHLRGTLANPSVAQRLRYLVAYFENDGTLTASTTFSDVRAVVKTPPISTARVTFDIANAIPDRATTTGVTPQPSDQVKFRVPTLDKFSGDDSDWFKWFESITNILGQYSLTDYIESADAAARNPRVAGAVFYALKRSVSDSKVSYYGDQLEAKLDRDPYKLLLNLRTHFDTSLTKSNILLTELLVLLNLRLDAGTDPNEFIKDYRASLLKLTKSDSPVATDKDFHRAILLMSLQDDSYETVRDEILSSPEKTVEEHLAAIRQRYQSLDIKDGHSLGGDGITSRRTSVHQSKKGGPSRKKGPPNSTARDLPKFPPSWRKVFGQTIMDTLYNWRRLAKDGKSQHIINEQCSFEIQDAPVASPQARRVSSKSKSKKRKARATTTTATPPEDAADDSDDDDSDSGTESKKPRMAVTLHRVSKSGRRTAVLDSPLFSEEPPRRGRRVIRHGDFHHPSANQATILIDSGCDQWLLASRAFRLLHDTGRTVFMSQAFAGRSKGQQFPVVSAVTKLVLSDGRKFAFIVHEGLYDDNPLQKESLLATHQTCDFNDNRIDDRTPSQTRIDGQPGSQQCIFGGHRLPLYFNGTACFFACEPITDAEFRTLPRITATQGGDSFVYEPHLRAHTRRLPSGERTLDDWTRCLAFPPTQVVERTLKATTQLVPCVETETREIMRDHFKTRLPELRHKRIRDTACVDTFKSSIISIRGYRYWTLFAYKESGLDVPFLMRLKSQAPDILEDLFRGYAIPARLHADNAAEFKGKKFQAILRRYLVPATFTEPHHPNQNLAEPRGGALKAATVKLLHMTKAPLEFWCYALEFCAFVRQHLARRSLDWKTPHERFFHETPDLSIFRIPWWSPVWYYNPRMSFPRSKMLPGRMVGLASNQGDALCYLVLTEPTDDSTPQVLSRSVVRRRDLTDDDAPLVSSSKDGSLTFYKSDGVTLLEDYPEEQEEFNETISPPPDETLGHDPFQPTTDSVETEDPLADAIADVDLPRKRRRLLPPDAILEQTTPPQVDNRPQPASAVQPVPFHLNPQTSTDDPSVDSTSLPVPTVTQDAGPVPVDDADRRTRDAADTEYTDSEESFDDAASPDPELSDQQVNSEIVRHLETITEETDDDLFDSFCGHYWSDGVAFFQILWSDGSKTDNPFTLCKRDFPYALAQYILENKVNSEGSRYATGRLQRWARLFLRECRRVVRRLHRRERREQQDLSLEHFLRPPDLPSSVCRRAAHGQKLPRRKGKKTKPGRNRRIPTVKYGAKVPQNIDECKDFDKENGNNRWMEAVEKEVSSLLAMKCFEVLDGNDKPSPDYKFVHLHLVYDVKSCGRFKARLVANGATVSPDSVNAYSSVVKGISVRLLDLIAHRDNLSTLCGDIGNAFITAPAAEKCWTRLGPEFGPDLQGSIAIIRKALYGLRSSSRAFRAHFAEFLRRFGFRSTRFDRDVWMRLRDDKSGYDYICTHVDDFKIVAKDPTMWMTKIKAIFTVKSEGPPSYYLGNDYTFSEEQDAWILSCTTYVKETLRRIETLFGTLYQKKTPLPPGCHPELDDSPLLDEVGTRQYQMLIGMAQWANLIGRLDIAFAVSSLSRFSANPRAGHLELALHMFGYIKKFKDKRLLLTSSPLRIDESLVERFEPDLSADYPDSTEEIDSSNPDAFGKELITSIFFDADHAHDVKTRRSISGIIVLVGSTPVHWISRRQGCIATSTYSSEFMAMRAAVEEAISIRYMLRCLGVPVTLPTNMYGDNRGSILSSSLEDAECKKKHVAVSYHFVREAVAAGICLMHWIRSEHNFADIMTKSLGNIAFRPLVDHLMF